MGIDGARRVVAKDSRSSRGSHVPPTNAIPPPRLTSITDVESVCGGPMLQREPQNPSAD